MSADNQQICGLQKCTKPSEMHHSPPLHRELMQTVSLDVGPEKPDRPLRNTFSNVTTSNSRCCSFVNPHFLKLRGRVGAAAAASVTAVCSSGRSSWLDESAELQISFQFGRTRCKRCAMVHAAMCGARVCVCVCAVAS